ncbi:hypothetical protein COHA_004889 [Chlorella ohadii]|uniref:Plastocyanin-like domain-containing protein n=1 Tax=Chlorella ohadii TaxID=2649997 RepID=A0AAD5DQZ5_9CHLO|nr:hypothetical protein COHA_004889 [Chlorella ohadii]
MLHCLCVAQHPTIQFSAGTKLGALQGAAQLAPKPGSSRSLRITMTAARFKGPGAAGTMIDFITPVYRNDDAAGAAAHNIFGPTLRLKGGQTALITLVNNLTKPVEPAGLAVPLNGFAHAADTNLHNHGLHTSPGVASQAEAGIYKGHDNIFYTLEGKAKAASPTKSQRFTISVPRDHMPGMAWYHPHKHGSTTIQVPTSNGLIIVEDDPAFLPDASGCTEIRTLLASAPETILHFALLPLKAPTRSTRVPPGGGGANGAFNRPANYQIDDPNLQIASSMSLPANPLMPAGGQPAGTYSNTDFVLVNGGWQPVIAMQAGRYQRWRLAWATIKRFASLAIVDPSSGKPAPCELLLLATDGVYLMQIPRKVDHAFLSPGNRAELLVKCSGAAGKKYVLRAQAPQVSPLKCDLGSTPNAFVQDTLATIVLQTGTAQASPKLKACQPARAGYAQDLRDPALAAAGAIAKLVRQPVTFTMQGQPYGCLVNGQSLSFPDPAPIDLPLGKVVEWSVNHVAVHPLHTHTNPFQLQELLPANLLPGCQYSSWFEAGDYYDVLNLPMMSQGATARIRLQPGEFPGYAVMHCHTLAHEDVGCIKVMKFSCGPDPQPLACPTFKWPVPPSVKFK